MMEDPIRTKARAILDGNVPKTAEVTSNGPTADAFTRMTGLTHQQLILEWDAYNTKLTSCNAFTGWFSGQLGCDRTLGFFEMEQELKKMGREIAWVDASSGARPKCGDIFRAKSYHVGVSYDSEGQWETCEGGQGGPSQWYDIIKRKKRDYVADNLQGWIDIELFFAAQKQFALVPEQLTGWWKVEEGVTAEYWWFGTMQQNKNLYYKVVERTNTAPTNLAQGPTLATEKGTFLVDKGGGVTVSWKGKPLGEKFRPSPPGKQPVMSGTRRGIQIVATKMLV